MALNAMEPLDGDDYTARISFWVNLCTRYKYTDRLLKKSTDRNFISIEKISACKVSRNSGSHLSNCGTRIVLVKTLVFSFEKKLEYMLVPLAKKCTFVKNTIN